MKTISDYTIYCTESQIKRAIELGAKMEYAKVIDTIYGNSIRIPEETGEFYQNPTAEQMIGFLLDNGITDMVISRKKNPHTFGFNIWYGMNGLIQEEIQYPSRPEATLAAIDAALDYLTNNKK